MVHFAAEPIVTSATSVQLRASARSRGHLGHVVDILKPGAVSEAVVSDDWNAMALQSGNPDVLYQSPAWWYHLCSAGKSDDLLMAVVSNAADEVVGLVPLLCGPYQIVLQVRDHTVFSTTIPAVTLLGSDPLVPERESIYVELVRLIFRTLPQCECIYIRSVPADGRFAECLGTSGWLRDYCIAYAQEGLRTRHLIAMPKTFKEYLDTFGRKTRYNFRRESRLLREYAGGQLGLLRVETEDRVDELIEAAASISRVSWQHRKLGVRFDGDREHRDALMDLARRGILRSYVLTSGDTHYAFMLGYQHFGTYYTVTTAYNQAMRQFSPGTVLCYLIIEDLLDHNPPRVVNFDLGEMKYKEMFGNVHVPDVGYVLLRRTWRNRWLVARHASMRMIVSTIRHACARRPCA